MFKYDRQSVMKGSRFASVHISPSIYLALKSDCQMIQILLCRPNVFQPELSLISSLYIHSFLPDNNLTRPPH